jgi:hypothetical protein
MTPLLEHCPEAIFPLRERQVQVYVVGMPRTGTVSLFDMFKEKFRADHEPESRFLTRKVVAYRMGRLSNKEMRSYLRHRDRRLGLELDTSYLNGEVIELLVDEFPEAHFILTIRDCLSWTDSMMNFLLNKPEFMTSRKPHIREHMELQFGKPPYEYAPEETVLRENGLHPLSCYLDYWRYHNQRVIDLVPADRLRVIKTTEIGQSCDEVEAFLRLPAGSLARTVHSNSAAARHLLLDKIPQDFVQEQMETRCGDLMKQYFPEILGRLGLQPQSSAPQTRQA